MLLNPVISDTVGDGKRYTPRILSFPNPPVTTLNRGRGRENALLDVLLLLNDWFKDKKRGWFEREARERAATRDTAALELG